MRAVRYPLVAILGFAAAMPASAESSYRDVIGKLIAASEGPRILLEHCAKAVPETTAMNTAAFESWKGRNADLLTRVRKQLDLSAARLAADAAQNPAAPRSAEDLLSVVKSIVEASFTEMGAADERQACVDFPSFVTETEPGRGEEIGSLLALIEHSRGVPGWPQRP